VPVHTDRWTTVRVRQSMYLGVLAVADLCHLARS
jgi:hypothetical protein